MPQTSDRLRAKFDDDAAALRLLLRAGFRANSNDWTFTAPEGHTPTADETTP